MPVVELPGLPEVRFAQAGPLMIAAWSRSATNAGLEQLEKYQADLIAKHGKVSSLTVLLGSGGETEAGLRERAVKMQERFDKSLVGTAIAVTAKGVAAVIIRTFLAGFSLVSSGSAPMKTFGNVNDAVAWLKSLPGQASVIAGDPRLADDIFAFVESPPKKTQVG